jgi:hypothetical protein
MAGFRGKGLYLSIRVSGVLLALLSGLPALVRAQFATSDRLSQSGFWPTQTRYPRNEYTGAAACAECHKLVFERAQQTSMAHSAMLAGESSILKSNPDLGFSNGSYRYDIRTTDGTSIYSVINGVTQQSALLVWAFGTSRTAQSHLFTGSPGFYAWPCARFGYGYRHRRCYGSAGWARRSLSLLRLPHYGFAHGR